MTDQVGRYRLLNALVSLSGDCCCHDSQALFNLTVGKCCINWNLRIKGLARK